MSDNGYMLHKTSMIRGASRNSATPQVAYFCAEYGISDALPIYSGGLGVLAGDIVQEAALEEQPFVAVGLFYRKGYFHQHVDHDGQHEQTVDTNPTEIPLELMKDAKGETLLVEVPIQEKIVFAQVWRYALGKNSLYLLDTDHWKNSEDDKQITDQLYSGDPNHRITQELVLGIGGYRALKQLGITPDIFHMNEGHSAFLSLELIRENLAKKLSLPDAISAARKKLIFTNHTLVPAGNDIFSADQIGYFLGKYATESGIGLENILKMGTVPERPGYLGMTMLALGMAKRSNAVSKLHAKKAAEIWPSSKFIGITNGVYLPSWVAPQWQHLWDKYIPNWRAQADDRSLWKNITSISNKEIWDTHQQLKKEMLHEVAARTGVQLDLNTLTVVWARRFASYKRPDLLFTDLEKLKNLLYHSERPLQIIIAGKSHPADIGSKQILEHISDLAQDNFHNRVVFVEDYSISLSKYLVSGADVWLNTPIFGLEASGTSGMKAAANGVIQFTVPDGWAYEVDWLGLGYTLPIERAEEEIYPILEKKILPAYYRHGTSELPDAWITMMKRSISVISPRFSSARLLHEYYQYLYQ